jgi:hypothetical protein
MLKIAALTLFGIGSTLHARTAYETSVSQTSTGLELA